jgi:hypothetical protein
LAGKPPPDRVSEFVQLSETLSTAELAKHFGKAKRTIRDWKGWARDRGHFVGEGNAVQAGEDGEVTLSGIMSDYVKTMLPIEELWDRAKDRQKEEEQRILLRDNQKVGLPNEPVGIMWSSDAHLGSPHVDYVSIETDFITVANTPGFYGGFHGDLGDNWIIGALQGQSKNQRFTILDEIRLGTDLLHKLGPKLLWAVPGNHDNWEYILTGRDSIAQALAGMKLLYDPHEVVFWLTVGDAEWLVKVRHQWRGYSQFNDSHAVEVGWERGNVPFDIGVGGHTHTGTWLRPFVRHKLRRYALITGSYKIDDGYARRMGFRGTCGLGSGATILTPDRDFVFFEDVQYAAKFLKFMRLEWGIVDDKKKTKGKRK